MSDMISKLCDSFSPPLFTKLTNDKKLDPRRPIRTRTPRLAPQPRESTSISTRRHIQRNCFRFCANRKDYERLFS